MSDDPQLPDTDDPWELLGLEPDADERAAKRAYARLIRQFRPDRSPDEFKRIRAAYELVRDGNAFATVFFDTPEPSGEVARSVGRYEPAVVSLPDFDALLLAGRRDDIVAALDSPVLVRASLDDPILEHRIITALAGLRWLDPVAADGLERRYRSGADGEYHRLYSELETVQTEFEACGAASLCPDGLARYLRYGRFVGDGAWHQLATDLGDTLARSPSACWDALTRMFQGGTALATYVVEAVHDRIGQPDAFESLDVNDVRLLRAGLWRLDQEIERRVRAREIATIATILVALVLVLVFVSRMGFAIAFVTTVAYYFKRLRPLWRKQHISIAWPALRDLMIEHAVGADALATAIERGVSASGRLAPLASVVRRDARWHVWAALTRAVAFADAEHRRLAVETA